MFRDEEAAIDEDPWQFSVVQIEVRRPVRRLPGKGEPLPFLVSIHQEGSGITYQRDVAFARDDVEALTADVADLGQWAEGRELTPETARERVHDLGTRLFRLVLDDAAATFLADLDPTCVVLGVDETILELPWETLGAGAYEMALRIPIGRTVATRVLPGPVRDPLDDHPTVRILVVENPTADLAATQAEVDAIQALAGDSTGVRIEVNTLEEARATRASLRDALHERPVDILHFAGHARFDEQTPGTSGLRLADGWLHADDVRELDWAAPPYVVFNSACESGKAARGRRLVSRRGEANGVAAAFLAGGCEAYLGHFWPVQDQSASLFASTFYEQLWVRRNIGRAVLDARQALRDDFEQYGDLAAFGALFIGDARSRFRRHRSL